MEETTDDPFLRAGFQGSAPGALEIAAEATLELGARLEPEERAVVHDRDRRKRIVGDVIAYSAVGLGLASTVAWAILLLRLACWGLARLFA